MLINYPAPAMPQAERYQIPIAMLGIKTTGGHSLVLSTLGDRTRNAANDGLGRSNVGVASGRELVDAAVDAEASNRPSGRGDVGDRQIVGDGCEGAVEGDGLGELGSRCTDEGDCDAVVASDWLRGSGPGEGGGGEGQGGEDC